jgi:hypothetical protein
VHPIGAAVLLLLFLATIVKILNLPHLGVLSLTTSSRYWVFTAWAIIEGLQHFLYKLSFGQRDTLGYVLSQGWATTWRIPLGGAIGVQLRRLRRGGKHDDPREIISI